MPLSARLQQKKIGNEYFELLQAKNQFLACLSLIFITLFISVKK
jgi:uncharacterized membrane protein (DUF485 family)